jgi:hypothetical protein
MIEMEGIRHVLELNVEFPCSVFVQSVGVQNP